MDRAIRYRLMNSKANGPVLHELQQQFVLAVDRGDCALLRKSMIAMKDIPTLGLLEKTINMVVGKSMTALQNAVEAGNKEMVVLLLEFGASLMHLTDVVQITLVALAMEQDAVEMVEILLTKAGYPEVLDISLVNGAIEHYKTSPKVFAWAIENINKVKCEHNKYYTLITTAVETHNIGLAHNIMEVVVRHKWLDSVDVKISAIESACRTWFDGVKSFLDEEVQEALKTPKHKLALDTSLRLSAGLGNKHQVVKFLIASGANLDWERDFTTIISETIKMHLVSSPNTIRGETVEIVDCLLEHVKSQGGSELVSKFVTERFIDACKDQRAYTGIVNIYLKYGVDLAWRDEEGRSALIFALKFPNIVSMLIEHGAKINDEKYGNVLDIMGLYFANSFQSFGPDAEYSVTIPYYGQALSLLKAHNREKVLDQCLYSIGDLIFRSWVNDEFSDCTRHVILKYGTDIIKSIAPEHIYKYCLKSLGTMFENVAPQVIAYLCYYITENNMVNDNKIGAEENRDHIIDVALFFNFMMNLKPVGNGAQYDKCLPRQEIPVELKGFLYQSICEFQKAAKPLCSQAPQFTDIISNIVMNHDHSAKVQSLQAIVIRKLLGYSNEQMQLALDYFNAPKAIVVEEEEYESDYQMLGFLTELLESV